MLVIYPENDEITEEEKNQRKLKHTDLRNIIQIVRYILAEYKYKLK